MSRMHGAPRHRADQVVQDAKRECYGWFVASYQDARDEGEMDFFLACVKRYDNAPDDEKVRSLTVSLSQVFQHFSTNPEVVREAALYLERLHSPDWPMKPKLRR